jgi:hypothetical protein
MLNHLAFSHSVPTPEGQHDPDSARGEFDKILALARDAGILITLDGQIGQEKYQSIAGSIASFRRFVEALCTTRLS